MLRRLRSEVVAVAEMKAATCSAPRKAKCPTGAALSVETLVPDGNCRTFALCLQLKHMERVGTLCSCVVKSPRLRNMSFTQKFL